MADRGRPTEYSDEYIEQAGKLCALGATDDEMADFFGVSVRTLYRWKVEHEEFCQAIKSAKAVADERVERSLYQKATGLSLAASAAELGIHRQRVYEWMERHPDFADTVKLAELPAHRPEIGCKFAPFR